jgi:hypothetical protein
MENRVWFFLAGIFACLGVAKASIRPWFARVAQDCPLTLQHVAESNPPPVFFKDPRRPVLSAVEELRWGLKRLDDHLTEWEHWLPEVRFDRLLDNYNATYEPKLAPLVNGPVAADAERLIDLSEALASSPHAKVQVALRELRGNMGVLEEAVVISVAGLKMSPYAMVPPSTMNSELEKKLRGEPDGQMILGTEESSAIREHLAWAVIELGALNREMKRLDARHLDLLRRTTEKTK